MCSAYSYDGLSYWLNDGNCLDPGTRRERLPPARSTMMPHIFTIIYVSVRHQIYTMPHQYLPCRKLDNRLSAKNVAVWCLQIIGITSRGLRTDEICLSNSCKVITTHTKRTTSHALQYVSDTIMICDNTSRLQETVTCICVHGWYKYIYHIVGIY